MFKKALLTVISTVCLFGSDSWQIGFEQGTSIYNIENSKKDKLSFECGYSGGNIYLFNKGKEISLKTDEPINFIINDEKKLLSLKEVNSSTLMTDTIAWGNLVYEIPNAKKIVVEANKQNFTFEPSNLKELSNFIQACTEYESSDNSSASTTNNNTSSTNTNTPFDSKKPPFKFHFKDGYDEILRFHFPVLVITSLNDQLIIRGVRINKEKCKTTVRHDVMIDANRKFVITQKKFPISLKEFEAQEFNISSGCDILRMDIETNNGTWSFPEN